MRPASYWCWAPFKGAQHQSGVHTTTANRDARRARRRDTGSRRAQFGSKRGPGLGEQLHSRRRDTGGIPMEETPCRPMCSWWVLARRD